MAFALLESTLVTGGLAFLSVILPQKWFRQGFVYNSFLTIMVSFIAITLLQGSTRKEFPPVDMIYKGTGSSFVILIALILMVHSIEFLQRGVLFVMDRLGIMTYIYVPLGLLGFIVVIFRNFL